jgi:hypothetical protein
MLVSSSVPRFLGQSPAFHECTSVTYQRLAGHVPKFPCHMGACVLLLCMHMQGGLQVCYVLLQTENMLDMMTLTPGMTTNRTEESAEARHLHVTVSQRVGGP